MAQTPSNSPGDRLSGHPVWSVLSDPMIDTPVELEDLLALSRLTATGQAGNDYSPQHTSIVQENTSGSSLFEPLLSPSHDTLHEKFPPNVMSFPSPISNVPTLAGYPHPSRGPLPLYEKSSSRTGPVASKAMLEAKGRRCRLRPAKFMCEECGLTFTALFWLKRHTQSHTGERPFACSIPGCSQRFYNSSDCSRHERNRKRHKDLGLVQ